MYNGQSDFGMYVVRANIIKTYYVKVIVKL